MAMLPGHQGGGEGGEGGGGAAGAAAAGGGGGGGSGGDGWLSRGGNDHRPPFRAAPASSSAPFDRRSSCSSSPIAAAPRLKTPSRTSQWEAAAGCASRGSAAPSPELRQRRATREDRSRTPAACRRRGLQWQWRWRWRWSGGGGGGGGEAEAEVEWPRRLWRHVQVEEQRRAPALPERGGGPGLGGPGGLRPRLARRCSAAARALQRQQPLHTRPGQPASGGETATGAAAGTARRAKACFGGLNGSDAPAARDGAALRAAAPSMLRREGSGSHALRAAVTQHVREGSPIGIYRRQSPPGGCTPVQAVPAARRTAAARPAGCRRRRPGRRLALHRQPSLNVVSPASHGTHLQTGLGAGVPTAAAGCARSDARDRRVRH